MWRRSPPSAASLTRRASSPRSSLPCARSRARPRRGDHPRRPLGPWRQGPSRGARPLSKALVVYLMAGLETPELAAAAVAGGADLIEIGSRLRPARRRAGDPPRRRARARGGDGHGRVLRVPAQDTCARRRAARADDLFGPARGLRLGAGRVGCRAAGAASLIVADLPADERPELRRVQLVAPTSTDERIALAAARTDGWLYLVTVTGRPDPARSSHPRSRLGRARASTLRCSAVRRLRHLHAGAGGCGRGADGRSRRRLGGAGGCGRGRGGAGALRSSLRAVLS